MKGKRKRVVLTLSKKQEIIKRNENGESIVNLAKEFGVGEQTVRDIIKNRENIEKFLLRWENASKRHTMKHPKKERINISKEKEPVINHDDTPRVIALKSKIKHLHNMLLSSQNQVQKQKLIIKNLFTIIKKLKTEKSTNETAEEFDEEPLVNILGRETDIDVIETDPLNIDSKVPHRIEENNKQHNQTVEPKHMKQEIIEDDDEAELNFVNIIETITSESSQPGIHFLIDDQ